MFEFYALQNLQDSQTVCDVMSAVIQFYALQNLQDSQTSKQC